MNTPQMLPDTVSHTPDNAELMALPIPLMRSDIQSNNHAFLLSKNVGEARSPSRLYGVVSLFKLRLLSLNFETKNTQPFSWVLLADVCAFLYGRGKHFLLT